MKKFKILISRISDGTRGGAEVSAFDQVKILHSMGCEVIYVTNMPDLKASAERLSIKTASLPWIQIGKSPFRYVLFWLLLPWFTVKSLWLVYRNKPDIINPHSREDQVVFTLTKHLHKRPVIWKDAGDLRHQIKSSRGNPFAAIYQKMVIKAAQKADHIYLLNKDDVQYLANALCDNAKNKLTNIPSSILYEDYDLNVRPQPRPDDKMIVGYAGRVSEIKGLEYLVEAAKIINRDDVEYWIYGNGGEYKKELKKKSEGLNFKFFDFTNEIPTFLNTFDIFVQTARQEGWGRNVKEAMYFGLPVVGSNSGGVAAQIEHEKTGLLFEPGNPKSLAEQLLRAIDSKELREKLGEAAQQKAQKDGDFRTIVEEQILPIYKKFLNT
jgi:glycosyltransferase involved in cell wall biosynthesis